ncbi:hypothetical protein [Aphanothece sacrum]|uniref:Spermidine/putrescine ABC transporter substrate-binding protein n=1 Tax=Aphanothece sacrum FPU1 TaxID=1920663 RepID=A0A401IM41_APHSA|nr:hypothetical protein [Aphanothece sacrum]GBF82324.1 spermidine/putrescine ABC transporter substrate-binding protein [Aphanothece sacrum FPU1]GBF84224.1 spermidine/putrescine ABC transporter substrate-binding protein [Aphanothece sacrum FPU3]
MLSSTTDKNIIIRNYLILILTVMVLGAGLTDMFKSPDRMGQQDRLHNYGRYISVGLVNQARKIGR